jgi:nucleotide-binding universal stress UspA family protein
VTIVVVDRFSALRDDPAPGTNLARHLLHHGIDAVLDHADTNGRSVAATLIVEAQQRDADLIVMGGYSHSRLRERIFGGVTYDLIRQSPTSLLMAH